MTIIDVTQEISDFLTEPFRPRGANSGTVNQVSAPVHPAANNSNPSVESMGRSLDGLSLSTPMTSNTSVDPSFPHLKEKVWFYGAITRAECDNLLNQYGQDGDFLVRASETNVKDNSLLSPFSFIKCILVLHRSEIIPSR